MDYEPSDDFEYYPCTDCGGNAWQDEFETKDGRLHCGSCFLTKHARSEGWSLDYILDTAQGFYGREAAYEIMRLLEL